jgi:hypothetical protein
LGISINSGSSGVQLLRVSNSANVRGWTIVPFPFLALLNSAMNRAVNCPKLRARGQSTLEFSNALSDGYLSIDASSS